MKKLSISFLYIGLVGSMTIGLFSLFSKAGIMDDQNSTRSQPIGLTAPLPNNSIEVDLIYDYRIPSDEELTATKKGIMESDEYKEKEKILGKEQAEQELDKELQDAINYRLNKNEESSGKIEIQCAGNECP